MTVHVKLIYPALRYGDPPVGRAVGIARVTATQIIVESAEVTEGKVLFCRPKKYRRDNLRPIPFHHSVRSWRLDGRPDERTAA